MKKLLIWLVYEIDDSNLKNRLYNNLEYVLAFLYFSISVFNAINCVYNIELDPNNIWKAEFVTTILVIGINVVILVRTYVRLHIQYLDEKEKVKSILERDVRYDKIVIEAYAKRQSLVRNIWLICMVIICFLFFYGNAVVESVGVLAFTCAGLTFFNDLIDIAANKYCVEIKAATFRYIKRR